MEGIKEMNDLNSTNLNSENNNDIKMKDQEKHGPKFLTLTLATIIFLVVAIINYVNGFDKMNNYRNSTFSSINAYVGGDAYNYIINSNYFTGYIVIATGSLICAVICATTALKISSKNS